MKGTSYLTDIPSVREFRRNSDNYLWTTLANRIAQPIDFASSIYKHCSSPHDASPFGETNHAAGESIPLKKIKLMGDKSPKSNQKKSSQKQTKASNADQQKKQALAAKSAANNKKK